MKKYASVCSSLQIGDQSCQIGIIFARAFILRDKIEDRIQLLRQFRLFVAQMVSLRDRSRKLKKTQFAKLFVLTTYSSLNSEAFLGELFDDAAGWVVAVVVHVVVGFFVRMVAKRSALRLVVFWLFFFEAFEKLWKNRREIDDVCNRCCAVYFFFLKIMLFEVFWQSRKRTFRSAYFFF